MKSGDIKKMVIVLFFLVVLATGGCAPQEVDEEALAEEAAQLSDEELAKRIAVEQAKLPEAGDDEAAIAGKSIAGTTNRPLGAPVESRWPKSLRGPQCIECLLREQCIRTFRANDPLYAAVSNHFPGENKVRVYRSPDGKRNLKIVNDLEGFATGFYTYFNTVVQVGYAGVFGGLPPLGNPSCVSGDPAPPRTIDPGFWGLYDFPEGYSTGTYKFDVNIGTFIPNLLSLTMACTTGPADGSDLVSDTDYESFGLEVFDIAGMTLDCSIDRPECDLWRLDQAQIDCSGNSVRKKFTYTMRNHCEGMTYEIKLSAVLPDQTRLASEPPLCDVYAGITSAGGGLVGTG